MHTIIPTKLKPGDEIRVIAPSRSMAIISEETRHIAQARFKALGLKLSFGNHTKEIDDFASSSITSRIDDIHDAFQDQNVKGILTVIGGFNSNQLLGEIDWSIIANNPKVFCGFSDITALNNAILAKTGLVTYSGLHYSNFGMESYFEYSYEYFKKCLMSDKPIEIQPSDSWTDDEWFINQNDRHPIKNEGWLTLTDGQVSGVIVGGNLNTLNLLQGTEYMPSLDGAILFIEDDEESSAHHFDRDLTSLIQQPAFSGVKAIVIGRFQKASEITSDLLVRICASKKELVGIPIIANVDFGHTSPMLTYPIGGQVEIHASKSNGSRIIITKH